MSDQKPNLLWHSNAPFTSTGYGQQTALFLPALKEHFSLACSAYYGLEGNMLPWEGIPIYPGIGSTHGDHTILDHARAWFKEGLRDGLVFTLMDVWVLNPTVWRRLNVASWCPVDHEPVPPEVADFFHQSLAVPIAMSRFGETQLRNAGLDPLYVPHAVDSRTYRPIDKAKAREVTSMPDDAFIVGIVAANKGNPSRKCFPEMFAAFKALHDKHPEARLYVHTELTGKFGGVDIPYLLRELGIPGELVYAPDQYRVLHFPNSPEYMAHVFSSFDVLLSTSAGEGFGIPVLEAQACGVPVIVSDFSAQPELCGAGWLVEGTRHFTPARSWQLHPSVPDIVDALEQAYDASDEKRAELAQRARQHALTYDLPVVMEQHMLPALEAARERFADREPVQLKAAA